jgi:hypothetical protein
VRGVYVAEKYKIHAIEYSIIFEEIESPIFCSVDVEQEFLEQIVVLLCGRVHDPS